MLDPGHKFAMETDAYQQVDDLPEALPDDASMDDDLFGDFDDEQELNFDNADGLDNNLSSSYLEQADEPPQLDENATPISEQPSGDLPEMADGDGDMLNALRQEGLGGEVEGLGEEFDLQGLNERELVPGEKAEGAEDYEDISDGDLPDEEMATGGPVQPPTQMLAGLQDAANEIEPDDLFGASSPVDVHDEMPSQVKQVTLEAGYTDDQGVADDVNDGTPRANTAEIEDMTQEEYNMWRQQQYLFGVPGAGPPPETEEENYAEKFRLQFPDYNLDEPPFYNRLFPPRPTKPGVLVAPVKPPKPIRPTKVNLELEPDQRQAFNTASAADFEYRSDLVPIVEKKSLQATAESSDESDLDEPLPGGVTMQDLEFMCTDFETLSALAASDAELDDMHAQALDGDDHMFDMNDFEQPRKKRRTGLSAHDIVSIHQMDLPSFDNPERAARKLARKVILDLNDPTLLLEEVEPDTTRSKTRHGEKSGPSTTRNQLDSRFKVSNDAEYDLLKQNHQHKVRGELGSVAVKHAAPAIRLQYPYFRVKMDLQDLRNHHRRKLKFHFAISFNAPRKTKRKHLKGKEIKEIYHDTRNLSLADNSTAVLMEYSEENPLMLSQAGMGNRLVNYYRRKTKDDIFRPKHELGDTQILLPEDKSPFYQFGHIDPGQEMTAVTNSMYRAPIFQQKSQPRDFLIVRESTAAQSQQYYMRNIDNLFAVGQELPSQLIPGTHSRMVTTTAKNRLKAISYRIARKNVKRHHRIRVEEVTKHFPESSDMQNRQKMKEFMAYNKEAKEWEVRPSEGGLPEEDQIQGLIKPEDVCMLESMQVGQQYLADAGYKTDEDNEDDDNVQDDAVDKQLAPWRTTKNFMQAIQGKAMLQLYGEGDPSGRGEAFSFMKTSMKGGFKAQGAPIQDAIQRKKDNNGHSYNVATQQKDYEESIRQIWDKQKASLGSHIAPSDEDMDVDADRQEDMRSSIRATPAGTPAPARKYDDETGTSFSRRSAGSQAQQKYLKITRTVREGGRVVEKDHIETDPTIIKSYLKNREQHFQDFTYVFCHMSITKLSKTQARRSKRPSVVNQRMVQCIRCSAVSTQHSAFVTTDNRIDSVLHTPTKLRIPRSATSARRNASPSSAAMPALLVPSPQLHHQAANLRPLHPAGTREARSASVQIVVKSATSKPTKSQ